jgi:hypothetical protein
MTTNGNSRASKSASHVSEFNIIVGPVDILVRELKLEEAILILRQPNELRERKHKKLDTMQDDHP